MPQALSRCPTVAHSTRPGPMPQLPSPKSPVAAAALSITAARWKSCSHGRALADRAFSVRPGASCVQSSTFTWLYLSGDVTSSSGSWRRCAQVHVAPVRVVIRLVGCNGHTRHEAEGCREVLEDEVPLQALGWKEESSFSIHFPSIPLVYNVNSCRICEWNRSGGVLDAPMQPILLQATFWAGCPIKPACI